MTEENKISNDDQDWRRPQVKEDVHKWRLMKDFNQVGPLPLAPKRERGTSHWQRAAATKERGIYLRTKSPWPGENMLHIYGGHEGILVM